MECHPDCGIVRSNGYIYDEKNTSKPIGEISKRKKTRNTLEDFVKFIVPWCPGCYMIRMAALDHVNPERKIFCSVCGQNIQMLLPLVSVYPCHYLDAFLFGYVIHEKSHSH
jgi:transcription elongation factor Elf1